MRNNLLRVTLQFPKNDDILLSKLSWYTIFGTFYYIVLFPTLKLCTLSDKIAIKFTISDRYVLYPTFHVLYPTGMYYIRHACIISDMHILYPTGMYFFRHCLYYIRHPCIISDMASIISDMLCNCILYPLTLLQFNEFNGHS